MQEEQLDIIPVEAITSKIYIIRGQNVMLDSDLAILYGVQTKVLLQAVKRNSRRFPTDFLFQLRDEEMQNLRSQTVTSSWGGRRYLPYVFTEHGIAMLSSVLNSDRAIDVNITIMRAFIKLRELAITHKDLALKIKELEKKYDSQFKVVFDALRRLTQTPEKPKPRIGFVIPSKDDRKKPSSRLRK